MKTRKINLIKIAVLLSSFLLLFNSCEKEEVITPTPHTGTNPNEVSLKFFKQNTHIESIELFTKSNDKNTRIASKAHNQFSFSDFNIDSSSVYKYEKENNLASYSFHIKHRENPTPKEQYNLVIQQDSTGLWTSSIFKFVLNEDTSKPKRFSSIEEILTSNGLPNGFHSRSGFYWSETTQYHCTQTGDCASGNCDNCGLCVSTTIGYQYFYNPSYEEEDDESTHEGGGNSTAGGSSSGISNTRRDVTNLLNLQPGTAEYQWVNEHSYYNFLYKLRSFLHQNPSHPKLQDWALGQIELESPLHDIQWTPSTGVIANNPNLKYTHSAHPPGTRSYFQLEDGSMVAVSSEEQTLTQAGDLTDKYRTETDGDRFYYIKLSEHHQWSEMLINSENLGDELSDLFLLAGKDLGESLGTYVLPIEDIKILIDGKDFSGHDVSRWQAAGGILLTVVPGGKATAAGLKILKPVKKITDSATKTWRVVIKNGSQTYTRVVKKLTDDVLDEFDEFAPGTKALLQEVLKQGKYVDTVINDVAQAIEDLVQKKGKKYSWPEVQKLLERGKEFNTKGMKKYGRDRCEIVLADGKRIDTYLHGEAIISRKSTYLDNIKESTWRNYCRELVTKYKVGKLTNSSKLKPQVRLSGKYKLEIPLSNQSAKNLEKFKKIAQEYGKDNGGIEIIFLNE